MRNRIDILHLAYGGLGGHRAVIEELSKALIPTGAQSGALLLGRKGEIFEGSSLPGIPLVKRVELLKRADLSSMIHVARIVSQLNPSFVVAHSHRHIPAVWVGLLLSKKRPQIVLVEHQTLALRTKSDEVNTFFGILFSRAVVFLTESYMTDYPNRFLIRLLRRKTAVIPNGIELPQVSKVWNRNLQKPLVLGMASRLIPSKRLSDLIEAIAILKRDQECILHIAGDGPDRFRLKEQSLNLGLGSSVSFDGDVDRSLMPDWYLSLDIYIQASDGETMSMSVIEAASFGLPIISTDEPGIREIFEPNKSIILLPDSHPENIVSSIKKAVKEFRLEELGTEAQKVISRSFNNRVMAQKYLDLMIELGSFPAAENYRTNLI